MPRPPRLSIDTSSTTSRSAAGQATIILRQENQKSSSPDPLAMSPLIGPRVLSKPKSKAKVKKLVGSVANSNKTGEVPSTRQKTSKSGQALEGVQDEMALNLSTITPPQPRFEFQPQYLLQPQPRTQSSPQRTQSPLDPLSVTDVSPLDALAGPSQPVSSSIPVPSQTNIDPPSSPLPYLPDSPSSTPKPTPKSKPKSESKPIPSTRPKKPYIPKPNSKPERRVLPARSRRSNIGGRSKEFQDMIIECFERSYHSSFVPSPTLPLILTNTSTQPGPSQPLWWFKPAPSLTPGVAAILRGRTSSKQAYKPPPPQSLISSPAFKLATETDNVNYTSSGSKQLRFRTKPSQQLEPHQIMLTTSTDTTTLPTSSDHYYALLHRKLERAEVRIRLREKEKLEFERYRLRGRVEMLESLEEEVWAELVGRVLASGGEAENRDRYGEEEIVEQDKGKGKAAGKTDTLVEVEAGKKDVIAKAGRELVQRIGVRGLKDGLIKEGKELLRRYDRLLPPKAHLPKITQSERFSVSERSQSRLQSQPRSLSRSGIPSDVSDSSDVEMFDFPGNLEQDDEDGGVRFGNDEEFVPRKGKGKNVGREENVEKKVLRKRVDRGLSEREEDGAEEEEVEVEQLSRQRRKKDWDGFPGKELAGKARKSNARFDSVRNHGKAQVTGNRLFGISSGSEQVEDEVSDSDQIILRSDQILDSSHIRLKRFKPPDGKPSQLIKGVLEEAAEKRMSSKEEKLLRVSKRARDVRSFGIAIPDAVTLRKNYDPVDEIWGWGDAGLRVRLGWGEVAGSGVADNPVFAPMSVGEVSARRHSGNRAVTSADQLESRVTSSSKPVTLQSDSDLRTDRDIIGLHEMESASSTSTLTPEPMDGPAMESDFPTSNHVWSSQPSDVVMSDPPVPGPGVMASTGEALRHAFKQSQQPTGHDRGDTVGNSTSERRGGGSTLQLEAKAIVLKTSPKTRSGKTRFPSKNLEREGSETPGLDVVDMDCK